MFNSSTKRPNRKRRSRAAATTVEFAFVAPVVVLILFASLEFSRANMIRHTAENAAYEGARHGIVPGATVEDCIGAAQYILNAAGVKTAEITVTPNPIEAGDQEVRVDIQVPMNSNGYITPIFLNGDALAATCTLSREVTGLTLDQ